MIFADGYPNTGTQALYGGLFLLFLLPIGQLSLYVAPFTFVFAWVPLIAIFLWPTVADEALSIVMIFSLGILLDLMYGSRLGQTALLFLVYFLAINPKSRPRKRSFMMSWGLFSGSILSVMVVLSIIAGFQTRLLFHRSLLQAGITALCVFPFLYGIWWYGRNALSEFEAFS